MTELVPGPDTEPAPPVEMIGLIIDERYRVVERIGEGGMGAVYRGEHMLMRKPVAIKFLHSEMADAEEFVQRFEREAQSASRLSHPHILQVTDFGRTDNGLFYLVMELIEGESLTSYITRQGRVPVATALTITQQMIEALEHAHRRGVVHRDLKPDNIMMIKAEGVDGDFVKLLDFGIAKMDRDPESDDPQLTRAGLVFGTPDYMAPEQALGHEVDARADLYACGTILFEMITGSKPFSAETTVEVLTLKLHQAAPTMRSFASDIAIPRRLEAVVAKLLAREKEDRFASASELMDALKQVDEGAEAYVTRDARTSRFSVFSERVSNVSRRFVLPLYEKLPEKIKHEARWAFIKWKSLPRMVRRGLALSLIAVISLLVLWPSDETKPVLAVGSAATGIKWNTQPKNIQAIHAAIARGELLEARAQLSLAEKHDPKNPEVMYLRGNLLFLEQSYSAGLDAYGQAMQNESRYKTDPVLMRDTMGLLNDKKYAERALGLLIQIERPACPVLAKVASTDRRTAMRQPALEAAKRLRCENVDEVQSVLLDLTQGENCDERRRAVVALGNMGDVRALKTLIIFRNKRSGLFGTSRPHACIMRELNQAIDVLKNKKSAVSR